MSEVKNFGEPRSAKKSMEAASGGAKNKYKRGPKSFRRGYEEGKRRMGRVNAILDDMKNAQKTQPENPENSDSGSGNEES